MDTKYNIRKIDENDFEFVYRSLCELEDEILDASAFKEIFIENIYNANFLYLLAEHKNGKIGFITFHTQNLLHHCGLVGEIQEFYIIPDYRNKGAGRQLFNRIIDYSEQLNLKSIEVSTNKRRTENIAIYENLGFSLTHNKLTIYR